MPSAVGFIVWWVVSLPELRATARCLQVMDWAVVVLDRDPLRIEDVCRVLTDAAEDARDDLLEGLLDA